MAYMVMKALNGEFLGDVLCVGSYGRFRDAEERLIEDLWVTARRSGADDDEVHTGLDAKGLPYGYCETTDAEWRVFELSSYLFTPAETKVCPACGTEVLKDMSVCYGCLHEFDKE